MINEETKHKFLKELAKSGNVYIAAMKTGIHRDSHYRWKKEDKEYRKLANLAEKRGRENNCDVAEHALMLNVKEKKMDAIKYVLSHNSSRYKPKKTSNVVIEHRSGPKEIPIPAKDFTEILYEVAAKKKEAYEAGNLPHWKPDS